MEKLQQLTKYEKLANEIGIIDKYIFLDNLKALAQYDSNYKNVLDNIIKLSEEYVEIEPDLEYDEWYDKLLSTYDVNNGICFIPLYNIVCNHTNTKIQEYLDYEEMKKVVYKLYTENYSKFIELIKQVITPSGRRKWLIHIPSKTEEQKLSVHEAIKVPEVPII